jgi:hypothetical protein
VVVYPAPGKSDNRARIVGQRYASDIPISGGRLAVKDNANVTRRRVSFRSADSAPTTGTEDGIDPMTNGAFVQLWNPTSGESACLPLPAAGWTATVDTYTLRPLFRYRDDDFVHGPCKTATIRHTRVLTVSCQATTQPIPFSLDEAAQGSLAVHLTSGDATYCALFGGTVVADTTGRQFRARSAPRPAACLPPPVACP